jgi:hypothetical protein
MGNQQYLSRPPISLDGVCASPLFIGPFAFERGMRLTY